MHKQVTHSNRVNLNIPDKLLKDVKSSKLGLDLLILAICIKIKYMDSRMPNFNPTNVQTLLRCGFDKAKLLFKEAKSYPKLFEYNPKTNSLLAKNFVRYFYSLSKSKKGHTMKSAHCYKLEIKEYSRKELYNKLKSVLVERAIWAYEIKSEKKDALQIKGNKRNQNSFIRLSPVSQFSIGRAAGIKNRMGVYRKIKKMEKEGVLTVTRHPLSFTCNFARTEISTFDPRTMIISPYDSAIYKKGFNEYQLSGDEMNRHKHVIFNHHKRITSRFVKTNSSDGISTHVTTVNGENLSVTTWDNIILSEISAEERIRMNMRALERLDMHDACDRKYA